MHLRNVFGICTATALLAGCGGNGATDENDSDVQAPTEDDSRLSTSEEVAVAEMTDADGNSVGEVRFYEQDGLTIVEATAEGLTPGYHGFHLHEENMCDEDAEEGPFDSAGGHYHSDDPEHGAHSGDMPSLYAIEDGSAQFSFTTDAFSADELAGNASVMIHEEPDNFGHIPERYTSDEQDEGGPDEETLTTGDAGDRFACGVVEAS